MSNFEHKLEISNGGLFGALTSNPCCAAIRKERSSTRRPARGLLCAGVCLDAGISGAECVAAGQREYRLPPDAFVFEQRATGLENRFTISQSNEMGELRDHPLACLNTGIKPPWADGTAGRLCARLGDRQQ